MKTYAMDLGQMVEDWVRHLWAPLTNLFQIGIRSEDYFLEVSIGCWEETAEEYTVPVKKVPGTFLSIV